MKIKINITVNRAVQILLWYLFFIVVSLALFTPIFAVFVKDFIVGASLSTIGFALASYSVAKSFLQIPLAKYLDRIKGEKDDYYFLLIGAAFAAVYPFMLLYIHLPWHLYLLEAFAGIGDAALMAAYYSLFARHVDKGSEGFECSLFSVGGNTISSAIGAALGGVLGDMFGFRFLFIVAGIINACAALLLFYLYPLLDGGRAVSIPPFTPIPKSPVIKQ